MFEMDLVDMNESAVYQGQVYTHNLILEHNGDRLITKEDAGFSEDDIGTTYKVEFGPVMGKITEKVDTRDSLEMNENNWTNILTGEIIGIGDSTITLSWRGEEIQIDLLEEPEFELEEGDIIEAKVSIYPKTTEEI